jgi:hypothetical protein
VVNWRVEWGGEKKSKYTPREIYAIYATYAPPPLPLCSRTGVERGSKHSGCKHSGCKMGKEKSVGGKAGDQFPTLGRVAHGYTQPLPIIPHLVPICQPQHTVLWRVVQRGKKIVWGMGESGDEPYGTRFYPTRWGAEQLLTKIPNPVPICQPSSIAVSQQRKNRPRCVPCCIRYSARRKSHRVASD